MKRKLIFVLLCGGIFMNLTAQRIEVKEPQLVKEAGTEAYYPKFTPDGKTILLTAADWAGLKSFDLETKTVRQLTTVASAGLDPVVSDDSKTVIFQKMDYSVNPWGARSYHSFDMKTQQAQQVVSPLIPAETKPLTLMKSKAGIKSSIIVHISQDLQIVVERNGQQTILTPNGADQPYIWAVLSPDQTKIAYVAPWMGEEDAFVCDLQGNVLANLGKVNAPQWLDNDWVVGMDDKDDGHVITGSDIVGATANGKVRQKLTSGEKAAMYPAVSPDGKKIAFNTLEGELYIMEVIVK